MPCSELSQTAIAATGLSYSQADWQRGYRSLKQEFDYWIDEIDGEIPQELQGTLFRNGPGSLDVNGQLLHHPFDGDGMVCAISFQNGRAHFRNRYVRTEGYLAEQQAGKILYRGVFGTDKPGGWLANAFDFKIKNLANTNILYWGNKLLALWEAAEPYRLDPHTLETLGIDDLDGLLKPGAAFSAHPWIDPYCDRTNGEPCLVNFAIKPGPSTTITIYEFNLAGKLIQQRSHAVPGFAFIHDFAITPHYCIFFQNPVKFNPLPYLAGIRTAAECITFQPEQPTRIILIPRGGQLESKGEYGSPASLSTRHDGQAQGTTPTSPSCLTFSMPSGFVFHHANAHEVGNEVVIDSVCYESFPTVDPAADYRQTDFETLPPSQLWRLQLNLQSGEMERQLLEPRCCEFPAIHPARVGRQNRYVYLAAAHAAEGSAPHQAILKCDLATGDRQLWSNAPTGYVGEPIFVPRLAPTGATLEGEEDDGWLLTLVFDAARDCSDLVILDARDLSREPVARLRLKHHVPYGLHGQFTPECFVREWCDSTHLPQKL